MSTGTVCRRYGRWAGFAECRSSMWRVVRLNLFLIPYRMQALPTLVLQAALVSLDLAIPALDAADYRPGAGYRSR